MKLHGEFFFFFTDYLQKFGSLYDALNRSSAKQVKQVKRGC